MPTAGTSIGARRKRPPRARTRTRPGIACPTSGRATWPRRRRWVKSSRRSRLDIGARDHVSTQWRARARGRRRPRHARDADDAAGDAGGEGRRRARRHRCHPGPDGVPPDLVLSDIAMPGDDGFALIARIRKRTPREGGRIPAIALSAHVYPEDQQRALAAGIPGLPEQAGHRRDAAAGGERRPWIASGPSNGAAPNGAASSSAARFRRGERPSAGKQPAEA